MKSALIVLSSLAAAACVSAVGYAFYFDYKRRSDPEFRKQIKKDKRRAAKQKLIAEKEKEAQFIKDLTKAMELVKNEKYPDSMEQREKFFMEQLQMGELLFQKGPENAVESAVCIFKALKVYPNPVDLLVILQKSVPEEVLGLVYAMVSTEQHIAKMQNQQPAGSIQVVEELMTVE